MKNFYFQQCFNSVQTFSTFFYLSSVFFMESRDTGLSANVYLNEMLIQLTVLLGYKVRNKKNAFKMYLVTTGMGADIL